MFETVHSKMVCNRKVYTPHFSVDEEAPTMIVCKFRTAKEDSTRIQTVPNFGIQSDEFLIKSFNKMFDRINRYLIDIC